MGQDCYRYIADRDNGMLASYSERIDEFCCVTTCHSLLLACKGCHQLSSMSRVSDKSGNDNCFAKLPACHCKTNQCRCRWNSGPKTQWEASSGALPAACSRKLPLAPHGTYTSPHQSKYGIPLLMPSHGTHASPGTSSLPNWPWPIIGNRVGYARWI